MAELRSLPEGRVREVADFIRRLREEERDRRVAWLKAWADGLTRDEAAEWAKNIESAEASANELPHGSAAA